MQTIINRKCWLLLVSIIVSSHSVYAQGKPQWELGLGAAYASFPAYRGSASQHKYLLPFPYITYRSERFSVDREGMRGELFKSKRWGINLSADATVPVDSDEGLRKGMSSLSPVLEFGPSLEYLIYESDRLKWRLRLPIRGAIAIEGKSITYEGVIFQPNMALNSKNGHWKLGASFGPLFGSKDYHDYYYGIPNQYATPQRPTYQAKGGYSGMRLTMGAGRYYNNLWLGMFMRYDNLNGAVFEDSPLVEKNSAVSVGVAIAWIFRKSRN